VASAQQAGLFLTFEGVEGSGKSTQVARLAQRLRAAGLEPLVTREPGGTRLGCELRALLLDPGGSSMCATSELLLYTADRAQHLEEVVEPALRAGRTVLCDRYLDATLAYQGHARGLGTEPILALHRSPPLDRRPDRTLLLDLDPAQGLERARRRNAGLGLDASEGRFEDERLEFHQRVRSGYLALAEADPWRIRVVQADADPSGVEARILDALADLLPGLERRS
jgi:dTMP kinase